MTGTIYAGPLKHICAPSLNCYSCPGALFACPIGALQVTMAGAGGLDLTAIQTIPARLMAIATSLPLLVIGFLALIGSVVGRAACGWACPFGWFQELLHKIPSPKFKGPEILKYLKYIVLITTVFLMPAFLVDQFGYGEPYFCKLVCPAGTLEGGIPLAILQPDLRPQLGWLFTWKISMLAFLIVLVIFVRRAFCRWLCPLGAFYAPFNKISYFNLKVDKNACIDCGLCSKVCPVNLDVLREIDSAECLKCLDCKNICPKSAISISHPFRKVATPEALAHNKAIEPD